MTHTVRDMTARNPFVMQIPELYSRAGLWKNQVQEISAHRSKKKEQYFISHRFDETSLRFFLNNIEQLDIFSSRKNDISNFEII